VRRAFSVSAYVLCDNALLLVNHVKQQAWVPIGGEIEPDETPIEALIREIQEEIGWKLHEDYRLPQMDLLSPEGFLAYEEHEAGPKGLHMNFAFLVKGYTRTITPCKEFKEYAWVTSHEEKSPVPPNVQTITDRILGTTYDLAHHIAVR
jgi:8-oxo-dGTP diphosphatase